MTKQDELKITTDILKAELRCKKADCDKNVIFCSQCSNVKYSDKEIAEAIDIAIECIEKQIPQKPAKKIFKIERWHYIAQAEYYACPTCGQRVEVDDNEGYLTEYYPTCECGQRIDWNGVIPDHHMKWLEKFEEWSEE